MLTMCKDYIKKKYNKPGNVYVGLVHRLDRPVGGVMVFAKTSKAASRLSDQVRTKTMKKTYMAVVEGRCEKECEYVDYLQKNSKTNMVRVVDKNSKDAKKAILDMRLLDKMYIAKEKREFSLVEINLQTGRPHQIRVQFSSRNHALFGDQRYNKKARVGEQISLWATKLEFLHPTTKEILTFESKPPKKYPWNEFL